MQVFINALLNQDRPECKLQVYALLLSVKRFYSHMLESGAKLAELSQSGIGDLPMFVFQIMMEKFIQKRKSCRRNGANKSVKRKLRLAVADCSRYGRLTK